MIDKPSRTHQWGLLFMVLCFLAPLFALGGCESIYGLSEMRRVTADRIARPAFMVERSISAGSFHESLHHFSAWERMHAPNAPAHVYIEGDGPFALFAPVSQNGTMGNPTPHNPVGLHLAAMDKAQNVAYLARPCQYKTWQDSCAPFYWNEGRFAHEVIQAYHMALDDIKARYRIRGFHLIGYGGGGGIAALVAAQRDDVLSLRSVAGILDHEVFTALHDIPPMRDSLNPVDSASELVHLPQHHFIGGNDPFVPPAVFQSWNQASGGSPCVHYTFIPENDHEGGWVSIWPELLKASLACEIQPMPQRPVGVPPQEFLDVKKGSGRSKP